MSGRQHVFWGGIAIAAIFFTVWGVANLQAAFYITSTVLAQMIATDAFMFVLQYRKVNWRGSPWGRHVMRLCVILGVTFETVVFINILYALHHYNLIVIGGLTLALYGAISAEMHNRRHLERQAREKKRQEREAHSDEGEA